jgi:hypothetical protein
MRERAARLLRQYGPDFRRLAEAVDSGEMEKGDCWGPMINARKRKFRRSMIFSGSISSSRRSAFGRQPRPAIV